MRLTSSEKGALVEKVRQGALTASQANVEMVRARRVMLITTALRAEVRRALNEAVKSGLLKRVRRDGLRPEAYYHPSFEYLVAGARNAHEREVRGVARFVYTDE